MSFLKWLLIVSIALPTLVQLNAELVSGQTSAPLIRGLVNDQNGNLIAGATITLIDPVKGQRRTTFSDSSGNFVFPGIQPGHYQLEVTKEGFRTFRQSGIRANVDSPIQLLIEMQVGTSTETVEVSSADSATLPNPEDGSIGNVFEATQIGQLPIEIRNIGNLLTLQPGVSRFGFVTGARSDQATISLDGIDTNDPIRNGFSSQTLRLSVEAVQEFRFTVSTFDNAQGRSSGGQISIVSKSGTNRLRGAVILTGRRTAWSANDFFNNRAGVERPEIDRNIFGGAIGGPIVKDRLFFFYSFESDRTKRGISVLRTIPVIGLADGVVRFRNSQNQIVSINCQQLAIIFPNSMGCNSSSLAVLGEFANRYQPNSFEVGDSLPGQLMNSAGYRFNADNDSDNNTHLARFDANLWNQQIFLRLNSNDDNEIRSSQFPDTPRPSNWRHPFGFAFGTGSQISARIYNSLRIGMTRLATSNTGDSVSNSASFAGILTPRTFARTIAAIDRVFNVSDSLSIVSNRHTIEIGANVRLIRSNLTSFARSYDSFEINPFFYLGGRRSVSDPINTYLVQNSGYLINSASIIGVQNAVAAVMGRISNYTANYTYDRNGELQDSGTSRTRDFRTEEYEIYAQNRLQPLTNLSLNFGLHYGLSRPVYESAGFELSPTVSLTEYFNRRMSGAARSVPFNDLISIDYSGPANGRPPIYNWDRNNVQPRVSIAWSPMFRKGILRTIFGKPNESVIRGGISIVNDLVTMFIAARFDNQNTLGFTSASAVQSRYNLQIGNGPLFTGFGQMVRNLPNLTTIPRIEFPRQASAINPQTALEVSIDRDMVTPENINWSATFERRLPFDSLISVSYVLRKARKILQARDAAAVANFVDPHSGMDWFSAASQLEKLRQQSVPVAQIEQIAYFSNLFPSNLAVLLNSNCNATYTQTQAVYALVTNRTDGCGTNLDWTSVQLKLSRLSALFPNEHIFYQPQYSNYRAWSSIGQSNYSALILTFRQRLGKRLLLDVNYTLSKSVDDGSGLQSSLTSSTSTIINPFRQRDMLAYSDFDMRHNLNFNTVFRLPFGRGERLFGGSGRLVDALIGKWQISAVGRFNSGLPISAPTEIVRTTNATVGSFAVKTGGRKACPTRGGSLFGCDPIAAYRSFRSSLPGESGDRNVFRLPGYWSIDIGFGKSFALPWKDNEIQFRWEIFNLTNTQAMGTVANYSITADPQTATPPTDWGAFVSTQGSPRNMQFVLRYSF